MKLLGLGLLAVCLSAGASEPWYVGADVGIAGNYTQQGGNNGRIYMGYEVVPGQAVEVQLYQFNLRRIENIYGYTYQDTIRAKGGAVAWASAWPLTDKIDLNSRLGVSYTETRVRPQGNGVDQFYTRVGPLASVGASYALTENIKLRSDVSYTQLQTGYHDNLDHTVLSAGLAYKF
ncbi:outer membrane beta-barrel protein [Duganella sp. FT80W]|uniref:Outer membrane beta-barrel protein n=1 Tax=Duganella guangzhouensis TaxID=2666084 RepID=A0A6I2L420_9BURK|nr:outer membrane beta-barrel protein [Duganella guangzhouensis]MRW90989.1 outer membrane beta-barrel protein [Duganella guangzhouensis]